MFIILSTNGVKLKPFHMISGTRVLVSLQMFASICVTINNICGFKRHVTMGATQGHKNKVKGHKLVNGDVI